jgi:hypothetical protein
LSDSPAHPFHITHLITPALEGIIRAISDRGRRTEAERLARGNTALVQILSFVPYDAAQLMLAGQAVLFNEVLADSAQAVLRGMDDSVKLKSIAGIINLGRLTQGHLDRLKARGNVPHKTDVRAPEDQKIDPPAAERDTEPARRPRPAAAPTPVAKAEPRAAAPTPRPPVVSPAVPSPAAPSPRASPAGPTEPETSWLDAPYDEWLIETPADRTHREDEMGAVGPQTPTHRPERVPGPPTQRTATPPSAATVQPRVPILEEAAGD